MDHLSCQQSNWDCSFYEFRLSLFISIFTTLYFQSLHRAIHELLQLFNIFFTQTWSPFHFMVHTPCQNYLLKIPNSLLLSKRKSWTFQPNFQGSLSSFPLVLPSHDFQFNFTISLLSPGWRGIFPFVCFVSFFPLQPDWSCRCSPVLVSYVITYHQFRGMSYNNNLLLLSLMALGVVRTKVGILCSCFSLKTGSS